MSPAHALQRVEFRARGRVQGVGYRYFVEQTARALGLTGWVRNSTDGSVEGELQGAQDALTNAVERLRTGPALAHVLSVDTTELPADETEQRFLVRF
jgi:acylphosphatase